MLISKIIINKTIDIESIEFNKKIDNECRYDMESMLYAFADKLLDGKELEKVKQEISMTKLGEILVEDWNKKGRRRTNSRYGYKGDRDGTRK